MSTFDANMEPMLEMFVFETTTLLDQLDQIILEAEKLKKFSPENINEIFRIMHTIKGSSAMMGLDEIANLAHYVEDMFFIIRENNDAMEAHSDAVFELTLQCSDYFKHEMDGIQGSDYTSASSALITNLLKKQIDLLRNPGIVKPSPSAQEATKTTDTPVSEVSTPLRPVNASTNQLQTIRVLYEDGCQMENVRAFMLITQLHEVCDIVESDPPNPQADPSNSAKIVANGLLLRVKPSLSMDEVVHVLDSAVNIKSYEFIHEAEEETMVVTKVPAASVESDELSQSDLIAEANSAAASLANTRGKQNLISVNQLKLDQLMDVVGEIVIAQSMVASNPDLRGLQLDNFSKAIRQLRKLTDELQDITMSIRMVPMSQLFHKMNRVVRDMNKKLDKNVQFEVIGEDTEVDKTINDIITDPFMHMIRNAMDHAIESREERIAKGKDPEGKITLSAQNIGGEIVISVTDDGKGLDAKQILAKARKNGILTKPDNEYSTKDIYNMIMLPGFSTNAMVTEFSGRGVGMDVVKRNIERVSGTVSIESTPGKGTTFFIKIPLTLAIVDGLEFMVGETIFTIPITSIRQTFKVETSPDCQVFHDTNGAELIKLRNEVFSIIRLHTLYDIKTDKTKLEDGTMILIENNDQAACIFVDDLVGEQQVVVKPFPTFLSRYDIKGAGLAGCTILGDGNISLILDANGLLNTQ